MFERIDCHACCLTDNVLRVPEGEHTAETPRTSIDSGISISRTPKSTHKTGTPRKSLTPRSAVSSLRSHLHRHSNSKRGSKNRRSSISNVFSRHSNSNTASVVGAQGPETFEPPPHDAGRESIGTGRPSVALSDNASLVPLPSSPIAIPALPPPSLKLDLGPPVALSPFVDMGEAAKRWEAQVLDGETVDVPKYGAEQSPVGKRMPRTPSMLDLVGMVPVLQKTRESGKTPDQGRLLMTPTPLEPDDPFADMPTPMPGTSHPLELNTHIAKPGLKLSEASGPATSSPPAYRQLSSPSDPLSHLHVREISFGNASDLISSLDLSAIEESSSLEHSQSSAALSSKPNEDVDASLALCLQDTMSKLSSGNSGDTSSITSVRGSSPAFSDLNTPIDQTPLGNLPSPTRTIQLPIRSAPIRQAVIHEPEVGSSSLSCGLTHSLTVRQKFFPSAMADPSAATPQDASRREMSLDTTESTDSSSSFHDSVLSPLSSSMADEAIQDLPPLTRCDGSSTMTFDRHFNKENSSPTRTPSMGDKVAFDLQRSERNARYNALCSGQYDKMADEDSELQLADYSNAGPGSQHKKSRSTDTDSSDAGGVRLPIEVDSKTSSEAIKSPSLTGRSHKFPSLAPKRIRFASRVPSASPASDAPQSTAERIHRGGSDVSSIGSDSSFHS